VAWTTRAGRTFTAENAPIRGYSSLLSEEIAGDRPLTVVVTGRVLVVLTDGEDGQDARRLRFARETAARAMPERPPR
jgi:hypothetical protein